MIKQLDLDFFWIHKLSYFFVFLFKVDLRGQLIQVFIVLLKELTQE